MRSIVAHFSGGDSFRKLEYVPAGIPVLAKGDVKPFGRVVHSGRFASPDVVAKRNYRLTLPGDFLLTTRDLTQAADFLGLLAPVPESDVFLVNQGANVVRFSPDVDGRFIVYWCNGPMYRAHMKSHHVGSTQIHIRKDDFLDAPLLLPPLAEQHAMASVLGAFDDKIDNATIASRRSDEMIAALYRAYIGDAELSQAPLFSVVRLDFGEPFKGDFFNANKLGRPLIRIRDLRTFDSQVWTTEERARETLVQPGDVLVGMDAEFRPTAWLGQPGLLNQRVCRVHGFSAGPAFVREALKEPLAKFERYKTGTTVIHLNKRDLEEVRVPVPSADVLEAFERIGQPLYEHRVSLGGEVQALQRLRDFLLPRLLSGDLHVREAEAVIEEAL